MRRSLRKNVRQLHQDEKLAKMLQGEEEREAARVTAAWREVLSLLAVLTLLAILTLLALLRRRGRPIGERYSVFFLE